MAYIPPNMHSTENYLILFTSVCCVIAWDCRFLQISHFAKPGPVAIWLMSLVTTFLHARAQAASMADTQWRLVPGDRFSKKRDTESVQRGCFEILTSQYAQTINAEWILLQHQGCDQWVLGGVSPVLEMLR